MSVITIKQLTPVLYVLGFLLCFNAPCQNISIQLLNSQEKTPIPMAHIYDSESNSLYVTDENGLAKITRFGKKPLILTITHVSYDDTVVVLNEQAENFIFFLNEHYVNLGDFIVYSSKSPEEVLRLAIDKIKHNYSSETTTISGSYFEKLTLKNDELYTIEAKILGEKSSYKNKTSSRKLKIRDRTYLGDYDVYINKSLNLDKAIRYASGYNIVHFMDLVKTDIEFLNQRKLDLYNFEFIDSLASMNSKVQIFFSPKSDKKGKYIGLIILDKESLAFEYCSYQLTDLGLRWANLNFIHGPIANSILKFKNITGIVEYKYSDTYAKWYLKNCFYSRTKENMNFTDKLKTETFFSSIEEDKTENSYRKLPFRGILIELLEEDY